MIGISYSSSIIGVDAHLVSVQTKISGLIKKFSIIGLPDSILKEAKDRVRCAIEQSGFTFPYGDIVVNLSPATIPKYGSGYDLAIALSILSANGVIDPALLSRYLALGELELDGTIKPVWGGVATASMIKDSGPFTLLANHLTARNAKYIKEVNVYAVKNLLEAVSFINGTSTLEQFSEVDSAGSQNTAEFLDSFRDVIGQSSTKRALEIVAAGGHNLLMIGPPGVGKSMLAKRVTS
ncbi:MAG: ATP-binding protein, partial [Proteobacteria bacterium]|nr:ATP-binding protein [Pseudomonadota bacterium]